MRTVIKRHPSWTYYVTSSMALNVATLLGFCVRNLLLVARVLATHEVTRDPISCRSTRGNVSQMGK